MPTYVNHKLKFTFEDLLQIPEDDLYQHEIYDGVHVASPPPGTEHQYVSKRMQHQLYTKIELAGHGEVYDAPTGVEIATYDVLEPDLVVVLKRHAQIIRPSRILGIPDLVVEILSPSTRARDRGIKRERYEAAGVPEYWILDPDARTAEVYRYNRVARTYDRPQLVSDTLEYRFEDRSITIDLRDVF